MPVIDVDECRGFVLILHACALFRAVKAWLHWLASVLQDASFGLPRILLADAFAADQGPGAHLRCTAWEYMGRGNKEKRALYRETKFKEAGFDGKRQRPTRNQAPSILSNVDVHGILFAIVAIVFVVYPLAQWALGL